jgi:hypothetical protein
MLRDAVLTYGVPFVGAVLLSVGLASGVVGGYQLIQRDAGLCGEPYISVSSAGDTDRLVRGYGNGSGPTLERLRFEALSPAEQRAWQAAREAENRVGKIEGASPHLSDFRRGVLVVYRDTAYYTSFVSANTCVSASQRLFPLGVAAIVLGVVGVMTPPLYRRYIAFERRQGGRDGTD